MCVCVYLCVWRNHKESTTDCSCACFAPKEIRTRNRSFKSRTKRRFSRPFFFFTSWIPCIHCAAFRKLPVTWSEEVIKKKKKETSRRKKPGSSREKKKKSEAHQLRSLYLCPLYSATSLSVALSSASKFASPLNCCIEECRWISALDSGAMASADTSDRLKK